VPIPQKYKSARIDRLLSDGLPVWEIAGQVNDCLKRGKNVVITAAPGAGKSTLLPLTILEDVLPEGERILMLEPRRLAARQVAERMARLLGEKAGGTAGYSVRFEKRTSERTRIEVVTEGILTQRLLKDPLLSGIAVVIFDEFHERSLESDLALALVRDCCKLLRPDLRMVVMSATMDAAAVCSAIGADHIHCEGRMFPVDVEWRESDLKPDNCAEEVAREVSRVYQKYDGDILAFLPGEAEIRQCARLLEGHFDNVHPLYGMLSSSEQDEAIAPSARGRRKIVLATPIAETSITIEGIRVVIDSGLCRKMKFDPRSGLSRLETVRISLDMARQRSGRAGRTAPGHCVRMWTAESEKRMEKCRRPEILEADLCSCILAASAWEGSEIRKLPWLTPPPGTSLTQALTTLRGLAAIDENERANPHGRRLASLPCHPRIAQMLESAENPEQKALAADLAALLSERDPMRLSGISGMSGMSGLSGMSGMSGTDMNVNVDTDICLRIDELRRLRSSGRANGVWRRIILTAEQYCCLLRTEPDNSIFDHSAPGELLASAFRERIAKATGNGDGHFRSADGQLLFTGREDSAAASEWIVAANAASKEIGEGRIFLSATLEKEKLELFTREVRNVSWDSREGRIVARLEKRIGKLTLDSRDISDISDDEITAELCRAARKEGLSMFDFNDEVRMLQLRIAMVARWHPELELPPVTVQDLLNAPERWIPLVANGVRTASELKKANLCRAIWSLLDNGQRAKVEIIAPDFIELPPSVTTAGTRPGRRIRLQYRPGFQVPVLSARIEDCFGLRETPRVDSGKTPILVELLSPGFKPVQITGDMHSFWTNTYPKIRNDLRRRYPKHPWP